MEILDIGANAGFLSIAVAQRVKHVDAVELNPYQVAIGSEVAKWLKVDNIIFHCCDFMQFESEKNYDVVMSYANHHTVDGNMVPELRRYFLKLHRMLKKRGLLLFETHCFDNDNPEFHAFIKNLSGMFLQKERRFLKNGANEGGNRYFYVFEKCIKD